MTNKNKLPVVGKRYKYKGAMTEDCFRSFMTSDSKFIFSEHFEELPDQEPTTEESSTVDNDYLTASYMAGLADAKIEALQNMRESLDYITTSKYNRSDCMFIAEKAQNLVNAFLENVSNSTPLEKHDKEDHIPDDRKKVKSIWKPISELPEDGGDVYIKFESSGIIVQSIYHRNHYKGGLQDGKPAIEFIGSDTAYIEDLELDDTETFKYIMLTDFVNQQISLEERITKLENK